MEPEKKYMLRVIELAKKGMGFVNPNPMVGAVIVKDDRIIGEGFHCRCGELHAERDAFSRLKEDAKGATVYVTLEPCCHYGKQPPCTEAIIEHGIKRVIIGSRDPNPLVAGKGARLLREKGIEVIEDFLKDECDELNPSFFHYITTGKPYVVLKYAMTIDGKIATGTGASKWITGEKAREHVHGLRGRYSAILAGIGTVLSDNPMLNCRLCGEDGQAAHQPLRVIADSNLRIPLDSNIVLTADRFPTLVAAGDLSGKEDKLAALREAGVQVISIPDKDNRVDLKALMDYLGEHRIDSVLIEGGGKLCWSAVKSGIVNHVSAYIAPKIFGGAGALTPVEGEGVEIPGDALQLKFEKMSSIGDDILLEYEVID